MKKKQGCAHMDEDGCRCQTINMIYNTPKLFEAQVKKEKEELRLRHEVAEKIFENWKAKYSGAKDAEDVSDGDKACSASSSEDKGDVKNMSYDKLPKDLVMDLAFLARVALETISEKESEKEQCEVVYNHIYRDINNMVTSGGLFFSGPKEQCEKKCLEVIEIAKKAAKKAGKPKKN